MTYNMTQLQMADTFYGIAKYANDSTNGVLFGLMIIAIFFVLIMLLKRYDFDDAFLVSSFISFILSIFLVYAKLLNFMVPLVFLILTAGLILWKVAVR